MKYKINLKLLFFLIFFCLNILLKVNEIKHFENNLINYVKKISNNVSVQKDFRLELEEISKFILIMKNNLVKKKKYEKKIIKPKISIIVSVYNKEDYINNFLLSVQYQLFEEYEMIIVDDYSIDKSVQVIQDFEKIDKRIKLVRNQKNYGSLYSRYIGASQAKGDYFIFLDSDDILLKYILYKLNNYIKFHNIDIIEFHPIMNNKKTSIEINRRYYHSNKTITKPYLFYIFYYYFKFNVGEKNTALWNKLIKKDVVIISFKYIGYKYIRENIIIENDEIILFSFFQNSKNYQYIDEIGYFYFRYNKNSISKSFGPYNANKIIHSVFVNIKFFFEKTNTFLLNKSFCLYKITQNFERYKDLFKYINTEEIFFVIKILTDIEESKYISIENKKYLLSIKLYIIKFNKNNIL